MDVAARFHDNYGWPEKWDWTLSGTAVRYWLTLPRRNWRLGVLACVVVAHLAVIRGGSLAAPMPVQVSASRSISVSLITAAPVDKPPADPVAEPEASALPAQPKRMEPTAPRVRPHRQLRQKPWLTHRSAKPAPSRSKPGTNPDAASVRSGAQPGPAASSTAVAPVSQPAGTAQAVTSARFDAAYLNNPRPRYPAFSLRLREEGQVLLKVLVTAQGLAGSVTLSQGCGYARLDKAALEAVRQWHFVPARQGDLPIDSWVMVPINFSLRGEG